jgi:hypothetical protein
MNLKVTMLKSPSKEEKVVDMKAAAQQSRGATWQPSVEATWPPGDGAGAGAAGAAAGAGRPAGAGEAMLFETLPIFYPPHFSGRILRYFYWYRQQVFTMKALTKVNIVEH